MLVVERSNRTEALLEGLAERLAQPGPDPLAPATVVVQGPGMERWLAQALARRHGVCANVDFLFPQAFTERLFAAVLDERPVEDTDRPEAAWSAPRLHWSIARVLGELASDSDFTPLARHLVGEGAVWRRIQLAARVATLFADYATYRPEWVTDWSRGAFGALPSDARWQGRLFQTLVDRLGPRHFADRVLRFEARLVGRASPGVESALADAMPAEVEIFAVSTLAPAYLRVLTALARARDVHLSVLCPSEGYFAELWQEVKAADRAALAPVADDEPGRLFAPRPATPAARLLAGLGRLGADFQWSLLESGGPDGEDRFVSPTDGAEPPSLLRRLQSDLLDPWVEPAPEERVVAVDDDSIRVHLCHGLRRELEVIEAALRDAFERDPSLLPEDVIVMAPRIDDAAADIEAVFGGRTDAESAIPYRIADRGALRRSPVAECYAALLSLVTSRVSRSELVDWLSREPARARFGLEAEAVEALDAWAVSAGVRFGLDADHRAALDLEATDAHTWSDGLARLALAHAVGATDEIHHGTTAAPLDPFLPPETLGGLGSLVDRLRRARRESLVARPVAAWSAWLVELLDDFCGRDDANAQEHTTIRTGLLELAREAAAAEHDEDVPFEAVREVVLERVASSPAPQAFLAGGVTFCELVPLRAIPFRMVVLLGLADAAFPRGRGAPGYDLMARSPRPGDRDTRVDDRHLFLEALLSARDRLVVTVPGRDLRDGTVLTPSIVVTELLDAIETSFAPDPASPSPPELDPAARLRAQLVVEHPLQPFDARYFDVAGDARLLGRDADAHAAARVRMQTLSSGGGEDRRFLDAVPSEASDSAVSAAEPGVVALDDVAMRVLRATRTFTRDRLGLRLPHLEEVEAEHDPFELDGLDQYALGSALLEELDAGASADHVEERLLAQPILPTGALGRLAARRLRGEILTIARLVGRHRGEGARPDHRLDVRLDVEGEGTVRLLGRLDRLCETGRVVPGFTRIGRRSELDVWIRHLALCVAVEEGLALPPRSVLVARPEANGELDRVVTFEAVPSARAELARLVAWSASLERAPLPFFPQASRRFAVVEEKSGKEKAWRDAYQAYHGGEGSQGTRPEAELDLDEARLWEGRSPIDPAGADDLPHRFDALALSFFKPLLEGREVTPR